MSDSLSGSSGGRGGICCQTHQEGWTLINRLSCLHAEFGSRVPPPRAWDHLSHLNTDQKVILLCYGFVAYIQVVLFYHLAFGRTVEIIWEQAPAHAQASTDLHNNYSHVPLLGEWSVVSPSKKKVETTTASSKWCLNIIEWNLRLHIHIPPCACVSVVFYLLHLTGFNPSMTGWP